MGRKRTRDQRTIPPMIDRDARDRAAALVEGFWSGTTTNRQLEAAWPGDEDKGLDAVFDLVWGLHDDFKEHTAREADRANPKLDGLMANCVRFLRSDEPYTWPHSGRVPGGERYPRWAVWASCGLLGLWNKAAAAREERYRRDMRAHGAMAAWPFRMPRVG